MPFTHEKNHIVNLYFQVNVFSPKFEFLIDKIQQAYSSQREITILLFSHL